MYAWEKTVEYAFLLSKKFTFAAPLDWDFEKIGDTVFSEDNKYFIIEFKKDISYHCIYNEENKFSGNNYDLAKSKLGVKVKEHRHHIIVYFKNNNNILSPKELSGCLYFFYKENVDIDSIFKNQHGLDIQNFNDYCDSFVRFKSDGSGASGDGASSDASEDYRNTSVCVLQQDGTISIFNLTAFRSIVKSLEIKRNKARKNENTNQPGVKSTS